MHERLVRYTSVNGNAIFISDTFLRQESAQEPRRSIKISIVHISYKSIYITDIQWVNTYRLKLPSFNFKFLIHFFGDKVLILRFCIQGNRNSIPRHEFTLRMNVPVPLIDFLRLTRYNERRVVIMTTRHHSIFVWRSKAIDLTSFLCHIEALIRLRAANYRTPPSGNEISRNLICTILTLLTSFCISILEKRKSVCFLNIYLSIKLKF